MGKFNLFRNNDFSVFCALHKEMIFITIIQDRIDIHVVYIYLNNPCVESMFFHLTETVVFLFL